MSHFITFSLNMSFVLSNAQVKSRGCEELVALEDEEKTVNNVEDKSVDEEKLATGNSCPLVAQGLSVSTVAASLLMGTPMFVFGAALIADIIILDG